MADDIAIIGAGLAGLALTQSLLDRGARGAQITVFDANDDTRASDVPGTLMHPFPGRSMQPKPGQLVSAKTSVDFLRRLRAEASEGAVVELEMARPLLGGKRSGGKLVGGKPVGANKRDMADRLRREAWAAAKPGYPDWFDSRIVAGRELEEVDPNLAKYDEALVYGPAFSVDTKKVRTHLRQKFRDAGVHLADQTTVDHLERRGGRWKIAAGDAAFDADQVVLAVGWGLAPWFPGLPIRGKGGEVLLVRPPEGAELRCIINASGHVAPLGTGRGDEAVWSAGSTYWRATSFDERTDDLALRELLERCTPLVAALADSEPLGIGRGVRASYRGDNRPLVGPVPTADDLFVFGAFGSKGLLRIPELADQLATRLLNGHPIDERASTARVKREKWEASPKLK